MSRNKVRNTFEFEIANGSVTVTEYGWQAVEIDHNGQKYELEFETEEYPTGSSDKLTDRFKVYFADKQSEQTAKKIGFKITDDFVHELYNRWNEYSNKHFR